MRGTRDAAPAAGQDVVMVSVPATLSPAATTGREAFNANCAACHGINGAGNDGHGPPLIHRIYEPNHHGDDSFRLAALHGVRAHHWPFGNMPAQPQVSPGEIETIIAYVREVQQANGIR
ncbi:MAG: cytochrome c [Notoacmeibacter sp.]|nr:cytochrome c [Notoacmeibacter sp.]MCC0032372.1 cytochrome c [Brucellaceae bacterium]